MRRCLSAQFAFCVVAAAVMFLGSEASFASGGGAWGGGFGSRGFAGGSWGSRGGFRTPIRDFFAYRQPVRSLFRGVLGSRGGSRGWGGSAGYGSTGYGSAGYSHGSSGYSYGSAGGYGSTGYSYYSSSVGSHYSGASYGSTGYSTATHYSGINYGQNLNSISCNDCVGNANYGTAPSTDYLGTGDGTIISTDNNIIPEGSYYDEGSSATPTTAEGSESLGSEPPAPQPASDETTSFSGDSILNVNVPREAKVYVNGRLTKTTGIQRQYVSRNLRSDKLHKFNLEAVVVRDGKEVSLKRQVTMRPGKNSFVEFDFEQPVLTQLTVKVPKNAAVKLCGNETNASGGVRNFRTKLAPGKIWNGYEIEISYEKDGEIFTQNRTLSIEAGQKYVVDFLDEKDYYVSK